MFIVSHGESPASKEGLVTAFDAVGAQAPDKEEGVGVWCVLVSGSECSMMSWKRTGKLKSTQR